MKQNSVRDKFSCSLFSYPAPLRNSPETKYVRLSSLTCRTGGGVRQKSLTYVNYPS
jgi:hypothetical protein